MTEAQAAKVLQPARGRNVAYVRVAKACTGRYGAAHAATESGVLALARAGPGIGEVALGDVLAARSVSA
jgi:hypothetical protein